MARHEIISIWFDEFVECVWKLHIKELDCTISAYHCAGILPNPVYPKGSQIAGNLSVRLATGRKLSRNEEESFRFLDMYPNFKDSSGSLVQCVGKILGLRADGDFDLDCGIKLELQLDEKLELQPGEWVEVTGELHFEPDFSTLVIPPETASTVE